MNWMGEELLVKNLKHWVTVTDLCPEIRAPDEKLTLWGMKMPTMI